MNPSSDQIQNSLQTVAQIRQLRINNLPLAAANAAIKRFQALRFQATYPDLLKSPRYQLATRFFLDELYGDKDYANRDQQFARISGAIAKLFPQSVVDTAAALAGVHALTEQLDNAMAYQFLALSESEFNAGNTARYVACWRLVADKAERLHQLEVVLALGHSLNGLTRKPGLRTLLKMMRAPAYAGGLASLQKFLETGFDAFQNMRGADEFLRLIAERERDWIHRLFEDDAVACETRLEALLSADRPI